MEQVASLPFAAAFFALLGIVMVRANLTYWIGRGIAAGGRHTRLEPQLDGRAMRRAEELIARWGAPAVVLCFLSVGIQTAVNLTAGIGRMPLRRYLPAVVVGSVLWAALYATVGLAAAVAWMRAAAASPYVVGVATALVAAAAVVVAARRRSRRR